MMAITLPFLKEAQAQGFPKALYYSIRGKGAEGYMDVGDERKADWTYLLPLSKESSVLQLGAEWGYCAIALARRCKSITVIEPKAEKRDLLQLRASQEKIPNLTVAKHPPNDSFDIIAVIEPPDDEKDFFPSIYSRLKIGGYCYLAVKDQRYKKQLVNSGFKELTAYAVLPNHTMPIFFVPLSSPAPIQYFLHHVFYLLKTAPVEVRRRYQIPYQLAKIGIRLLPAWILSVLFQWFSPAFSLIAKKE